MAKAVQAQAEPTMNELHGDINLSKDYWRATFMKKIAILAEEKS